MKIVDQRINSICSVWQSEPMTSLLSISPSKEMGDCTRQRKRSHTSVGIKLTTTVFDRPLLCQLCPKARWEQVVGDYGGYSCGNVNVKGTNDHYAAST